MNINKNILYLCKQIGILPDHLGSIIFVLECMYYENYELLDKFDDSSSNKNALLIYKECEKLKFLKKDLDSDSKIHYSLSFEGKMFIERLLELSIETSFIKPKKDNLSEWIKEWIDLWKNDKGFFYKDLSSKPERVLRISEKDAFDRMSTFLIKYSYLFKNNPPKEIIMDVTKKYIANFQKVNFVFCVGPYNFIFVKKDSSTKSVLAELCESYGKEEEQRPKKRDFGFSVNN